MSMISFKRLTSRKDYSNEGDKMNRLADAFISSAVIQGILTLALWGVIMYMAVNEQDIPDLLAVGGGAILTFWFKTKIEARSNQ